MQNLLDRFAKFPNSTKAAILILVLILMVAGYIAVPYMKAKGKIDTLTTTRNNLIGERDRKQKKADNLEAYKEKLAQLEADLERAKQELPDAREIPDLLKQIDNLGRKIGLTFNEFEPQADANEGFYAKVPVKFKVTGDYHSVAVFFSKVGNLRRIVNIENIEMVNPTEKNGKMVLDVRGMAVTFRFVENTPPPAKPKGT